MCLLLFVVNPDTQVFLLRGGLQWHFNPIIFHYVLWLSHIKWSVSYPASCEMNRSEDDYMSIGSLSTGTIQYDFLKWHVSIPIISNKWTAGFIIRHFMFVDVYIVIIVIIFWGIDFE